jgi:hypothetical protein
MEINEIISKLRGLDDEPTYIIEGRVADGVFDAAADALEKLSAVPPNIAESLKARRALWRAMATGWALEELEDMGNLLEQLAVVHAQAQERIAELEKVAAPSVTIAELFEPTQAPMPVDFVSMLRVIIDGTVENHPALQDLLARVLPGPASPPVVEAAQVEGPSFQQEIQALRRCLTSAEQNLKAAQTARDQGFAAADHYASLVNSVASVLGIQKRSALQWSKTSADMFKAEVQQALSDARANVQVGKASLDKAPASPGPTTRRYAVTTSPQPASAEAPFAEDPIMPAPQTTAGAWSLMSTNAVNIGGYARLVWTWEWIPEKEKA